MIFCGLDNIKYTMNAHQTNSFRSYDKSRFHFQIYSMKTVRRTTKQMVHIFHTFLVKKKKTKLLYLTFFDIHFY